MNRSEGTILFSYLFLALNSHSKYNFMCQILTSENKMSRNDDNYDHDDELNHGYNDIKYFVDLYTAALHLRYRYLINMIYLFIYF